ncbi:MAG TPA: DUF5808 domain-containing protein [Actinomycetaceae bacterium]|nr:DUF5808 domain-containing protein [Actinomycetaceae bacterium]
MSTLDPSAAEYVDDVAAHLGPLSATAREAALADLREILAEGVTPGDLGSAADYAAAVVGPSSPAAADGRQGTILGVPYDSRGATDAAVRSRLWDPSNPAIFVPHVIGVGWSVNLGAVAVKLGRLRPDDYDADVLGAIPAWATGLVRAYSVGVAMKTAVFAAAAWRNADAEGRVPSHFTLLGKPDRWGDRRTVLIPYVVAAVGAAVWAARSATGDDRLIRPALGGFINAAMAGTAVHTELAARKPHRNHPLTALMKAVTPPAIAIAATVLPVRAGLRALWSGTSSSGAPSPGTSRPSPGTSSEGK